MTNERPTSIPITKTALDFYCDRCGTVLGTVQGGPKGNPPNLPNAARVPRVPKVPRLLLTVEEASRILGIGRSLMYELVAGGAVASLKIGRVRRIPVAAIQEFIARRLDEETSGHGDHTQNISTHATTRTAPHRELLGPSGGIPLQGRDADDAGGREELEEMEEVDGERYE